MWGKGAGTTRLQQVKAKVTQIEQKEMTSQKMLEALIQFKRFDEKLTIEDLETFVSVSAGLTPDKTEISGLVKSGLCKINGEGTIVFSTEGINLQRDMKLEAKPMKKIKMTGDDASKLIDQMFSELEQ